MSSNKKAVIVLSHGSRNPLAREQFQSLIKSVNDMKTDTRIEGAYFELAEPDLSAAVGTLVNEGYKDLVVIPFFLMRGNHVERDIPELMEEERRKNPDISFTVGTTLFPSELLLDLVVEKIEEAS